MSKFWDQWSDKIILGLPEIDRQHQIFIQILDELSQATAAGDLKTRLGPILRKLRGYANFHFGTEEDGFAICGYERADEHNADHKRIAFKLDAFIEDHAEMNPALAAEMTFFVGDWLVNHVQGHDKRYVDCFTRHGYGLKLY